MKDYPWGKGTPTWVYDATVDDSDKSFTVPAGKRWALKMIDSQLTCTATVGNRLLTITVATSGTNYIVAARTTNVTASQTARARVIPGMAIATTALTRLDNPTGGTNVSVTDGMPNDILLPAGAVVRVYDSAAVDAAADDLIVVIHYVEYDA